MQNQTTVTRYNTVQLTGESLSDTSSLRFLRCVKVCMCFLFKLTSFLRAGAAWHHAARCSQWMKPFCTMTEEIKVSWCLKDKLRAAMNFYFGALEQNRKLGHEMLEIKFSWTWLSESDSRVHGCSGHSFKRSSRVKVHLCDSISLWCHSGAAAQRGLLSEDR